MQSDGEIASMSSEKAIYTHGHHPSVTGSHARRTVENSAAFLIPHIKDTDRILDVGCGPGSITLGLARLASKGEVIGGDASNGVLTQARDLAEQSKVKNISFQRIDANALPFPDDSFDVTFCHQVLQHVGDPVAVLREMQRVTKPGGIVAAREADYKSFALYPEMSELDDWLNLYQRVAKANGAEPNAGRYLPSWARDAGVRSDDVDFTWSIWNYQGEEAKAFGQSFADRVLLGTFAQSAKTNGLADDSKLEMISQCWRQWSEDVHRFVMIPNGEIFCRVSKSER